MNSICRLVLGLSTAACILAPRVSAAGSPATVSFGNLVPTYDGTPKAPSVTTVPAELPVQVVYRNLSPTAPTPVSQVVYNDTPDPLALSYFSYGFASSKLSALGNLVQLGGTARKLESCDVILVTYAKASDWPVLAAANPAGYLHPVTLTIYEVTSTNQLVFRTEATQNILIPWRPLIQSNGSPWPPAYNGYAFRANIPFTNGITLPERVLVMVSFNTETYGFSPIGSPGPYNSLNVAYKTTTNVAPVGTDVNPDVVLQVLNGLWYYPSTGWTTTSTPLLRLRALSTETITPPTNAGPWQASARVSNPDYLGTASSAFTIQPAVASVALGNLSQVVDGNPKSATVTTIPPNLAVNVTYNGSPSPPSAPGNYAVHVEIANPNYQPAVANGELSLSGQTLNSWIAPWVTNGQIPGTATGSNDDPDHDSISNLMEYALALDPSTSNHGLPDLGLPRLEYSAGQLSLVFRKNLAAADLEFQVESAAQLEVPGSWSAAATANEIITTVGLVQTVRATLITPPNGPQHFLRLRVKRQDQP